MGKSKRKYRKKNKRTRKKRGGIVPNTKGNKLFDDTKNPNAIKQICLTHDDPNDELYNKGPTWIKYLEAANKGKPLTSTEKLAERKLWCGSNKYKNDVEELRGYCLSNSGIAKVKISNRTKDRCLPQRKGEKDINNKYCYVHLRPEDVHHCTRTCGRPNEKDKPKMKEIKQKENKLECNDARVFIGNGFFPIKDSVEAMEKYEEEVKKRKEKIKKEKAKKAKALAKAKAAEAAAKIERARIKEQQEKAAKLAAAAEAKRILEEEEKKKQDCIEKMEINLKQKFSKIETAILTHKDKDGKSKKYSDIKQLFDANWTELFSHGGIKLVEEKLRMLNGLNHEVSDELDECYDAISETKDFGEEADKKFEAAFDKYKDQIETMYVDIVKIKMELFKQDQELYDQYTPMDLNNGIPFAQMNEHGLLNYEPPTRCRKKKLCDDKRKAEIKKKKNLSETPEFCIGSVVRGGIYPKSSFDYTGVVIGNAIEQGVPPIYLKVSGMRGMSNYPGPLYPVVYYSPYYNNGSWPFYGLMYGVHRPKKSETEEFKTWYYKMIKRHGDTKIGEYPENTLKAMIKGVITQKGKKNLGKNPQLVPKPFIRYIPCKQTKAAEAAYNQSRPTCTGALVCKKPKYQRSKTLCINNPSCKYIGTKGGRRKRKRTRRKKKKKRRCTKKKR